MNASNVPVATIAPDALAALTEVAMMRLPLRAAESRRRGEVGALLASEAELVRSLTAHLNCLRVNCSGSHGTGSLAEATSALTAALAGFAGELNRLAGDYARLLRADGTGSGVCSTLEVVVGADAAPAPTPPIAADAGDEAGGARPATAAFDRDASPAAAIPMRPRLLA